MKLSFSTDANRQRRGQGQEEPDSCAVNRQRTPKVAGKKNKAKNRKQTMSISYGHISTSVVHPSRSWALGADQASVPVIGKSLFQITGSSGEITDKFLCKTLNHKNASDVLETDRQMIQLDHRVSHFSISIFLKSKSIPFGV